MQYCGLDHIVILTRSLDRASELFQSLGFMVAPKVSHSAVMGTSNQCIIMQTTYIELLAIDRPTDANAGWRSLIEDGAGLRGLAFRGHDLDALYTDLTAKKLEVSPPLAFSRPIDNSADSQTARFRVCRIDLKHSPGYRSFICQHLTPELIWHKPYMDHPNGVRDLTSIATPSNDPVAANETLSALQPEEQRTATDVSPRITIGAIGSDSMLSFSVEKLEPVKLLLDKNGIAFEEGLHRLEIVLPELSNLKIRFEIDQ